MEQKLFMGVYGTPGPLLGSGLFGMVDLSITTVTPPGADEKDRTALIHCSKKRAIHQRRAIIRSRTVKTRTQRPLSPQIKETDEPSLDYTAHRVSLDLLLKMAQEEYKQITFDRKNAQSTSLRNYLWLSTVIIAVEYAASRHIFRSYETCPSSCVFIAMALLLAFVVFVLGIDTARGRGSVLRPTRGYVDPVYKERGAIDSGDVSQMLYGDIDIRYDLLTDLENAIIEHTDASNRIGIKLRVMSCLLLASLCMGLFAGGIFIEAGHAATFLF